MLKAIVVGLRQPSTDENQRQTAGVLDSLCLALNLEDDANSYLWGLWEIMTIIASSPEVTVDVP